MGGAQGEEFVDAGCFDNADYERDAKHLTRGFVRGGRDAPMS
jgi:hypothetical protein